MQEVLEDAIARVYGTKERATFAGRTDRGVHAAGQVVSVADRQPALAAATIARALNAILPEDVAICRIERIDDAFHARYDARWREYRYRMWTGTRAPLARDVVWRVTGRIDVEAMRRACSGLVGEHDFAAFASGGEGVPWSERRHAPRGTVRLVYSAEIHRLDPWWEADVEDGTLFELRIVADAFLPRMVRNVAGALVEIGRGSRGLDWIEALLAARDRRQAGMTAPPHGLILWRVGYGDDSPPST